MTSRHVDDSTQPFSLVDLHRPAGKCGRKPGVRERRWRSWPGRTGKGAMSRAAAAGAG